MLLSLSRRESKSTRHMVACSLSLALFAFPALAADFQGRVIHVIDGDTIDVLVNQRPVRVRLAGIDAPEKAQPFGDVSRRALADLVGQRLVHVRDAGADRYGRSLGVVTVAGIDANHAQVQAGYAWVYRQYSRDAGLYAAETGARSRRSGLWRDPAPVPPWQWRRSR